MHILAPIDFRAQQSGNRMISQDFSLGSARETGSAATGKIQGI
ncbi:hypothetical protein BN1221_01177 [Brenneria goodwinii]|uniref:Uncharacterized protein n=1 Tax=Brenneria goodwinii TaxID=1109412 RepID=A0A0G4JSV6_9GAMM|nr:hypothetical protein BN1221_01177 [Brenneria goodwinii]